ncbi:MAG: SET domain-containing protein-lysine N-methyltransferase [Verrucomicrobia bacterium]|nr:SET domain-containing protein-lysine N-methyltransferase [Verrucomicrobiota bacterium]
MSATSRPRPTRSPWAELRNSRIHGRGLYASKAIPAGTRIIEYRGERITKAESDRREERRRARARRGDGGCVYIFEINQRHDLDGSMAWNTARLINHSCEANCESSKIRGRIWIVALRDIAEGEELSFDYGFGLENWREHPCRCGTAKCAGYIVTKTQRWRVRKILTKARVAARKSQAAAS